MHLKLIVVVVLGDVCLLFHLFLVNFLVAQVSKLDEKWHLLLLRYSIASSPNCEVSAAHDGACHRRDAIVFQLINNINSITGHKVLSVNRNVQFNLI